VIHSAGSKRTRSRDLPKRSLRPIWPLSREIGAPADIEVGDVQSLDAAAAVVWRNAIAGEEEEEGIRSALASPLCVDNE